MTLADGDDGVRPPSSFWPGFSEGVRNCRDRATAPIEEIWCEKTVVAVKGAAARPTHMFEQGPAAAIAHNPGRLALYSGYVSTPPGAVRLNRMKASTFPGSDVASLRRPPI